MPEYARIADRIYEEYLRQPKSKKKLSRKKFMKRYGHKKLKRKTGRTRKTLKDVGSALTPAEKRRMTD